MFYSIIPQAKLPRNIDGFFTYKSELKLKANDLVIIEFRKTKVMGIVVCPVKTEIDKKIKPVLKVMGQAPSYFAEFITWLGDYYISSAGFIFDMITPQTPKRISKLKINLNKSFGSKFLKLKTSSAQIKIIKNILKNSFLNINSYPLSRTAKYITYIKLIERAIFQKKQTILLCPTEESLSAMLLNLPKKWQPKTAVFTSSLYSTKGKYWNIWNCANAGKFDLIVGTRSAIFAPLHKLGLIIIDMAESDDFKQYDQNPRYDAQTAAKQIKNLTKCDLKIFSDGVVLDV